MGYVCRSSVLACSGLIFYGVLLSLCFGLVAMSGGLVVEWCLFSERAIDVSFPLLLDTYSLLFSAVVTLISSVVLFYSTSYMYSEVNLSRFVWVVVLFVVSMNFLIFVPSFVGVILGWDGLGLTSFVLVIYYQSEKALGAGLVTGIMNRVGDGVLLVSLSLVGVGGQWSMWVLGWGDKMVGVVVVMAVVVAMTKSAQMPFSYWLPAAMSAPTPVSALVHSSTLVTAGVYLLVRLLDSVGGVEVGSLVSQLLLVVSLVTVIMSGLGACFEVDLKKVVALSTLSQLGMMVLSLGMGLYGLAFFHLVTHALFKALLFLSVGRIIQGFGGSQDLRVVGGLWGSMPTTSGCWALASMCLMGLPFLSGFYSKDLIIEGCLGGGLNWLVGVGVFVGVMLTGVYSGRVFVGSVCGKPSGSCVQVLESKSAYDVVPGLLLGVVAVSGGYLIQSRIFCFNEVFVLESGFGDLIPMMGIGGVLVVLVYALKSKVKLNSALAKMLQFFFLSMWFAYYLVPVFTSLVFRGSGFVFKEVDLGWNESVFGGEGVFVSILEVSSRLLRFCRDSFDMCLYAAFFLGVGLVQFVYP